MKRHAFAIPGGSVGATTSRLCDWWCSVDEGRQGCAIANTEPAIQFVKMDFHRSLGDAQTVSYFFIGQPLSD
jgi:hypothetical protein